MILKTLISRFGQSWLSMLYLMTLKKTKSSFLTASTLYTTTNNKSYYLCCFKIALTRNYYKESRNNNCFKRTQMKFSNKATGLSLKFRCRPHYSVRKRYIVGSLKLEILLYSELLENGRISCWKSLDSPKI